MFFFGKKKKKQEEMQPSLRMHIIPEVFYGGNDPVIYHGKSTITQETATHSDKTASSKNVVSSTPTGQNPVFPRTRVWIGAGVVACLVVVGGATWYYLRVPNTVSVTEAPTLPEKVEIIEEPTGPALPAEPVAEQVSVDDVSTSTTEDAFVPDIEPVIQPVSFPRILLVDDVDTDADGLTDAEEEFFLTNVDAWDSDGDGYYDGQEVENLYNPNGFAPVKIIDSGIVSEYVNPMWQYRLYYPVSWQVGQVDTGARQVLFSTLGGDFIEVRVFDRTPGQSFQDWFAEHISGELFQDLRPTTNRFKQVQMRRRDGLVGYVESPTNVVVLIYHPGAAGFIRYRMVMRLMLESFRPTNIAAVLPDQVVLPTPPGDTALSSSTQDTARVDVPETEQQ